LFLIELVLSVPFGGISKTVDIFGTVTSIIVLYLAYDAFRDLG